MSNSCLSWEDQPIKGAGEPGEQGSEGATMRSVRAGDRGGVDRTSGGETHVTGAHKRARAHTHIHNTQQQRDGEEEGVGGRRDGR